MATTCCQCAVPGIHKPWCQSRVVCASCGWANGDHKPGCVPEMWAVVVVQPKDAGGGGYTTWHGQTPEEAMSKAKAHAKVLGRAKVIGLSHPYKMKPSVRFPGMWDATPTPESLAITVTTLADYYHHATEE